MKKNIFRNIRRQVRSKQPVMGTLVIVLMLLVFVIGFSTINFKSTQAAEISGWTYNVPITISNTYIDENLVNYPILVVINSTIGANCNSGNSIRFWNATNETEYYYEIDVWNNSGDSFVWVNITSISSSEDTIFYMYYGNESASDASSNKTWDGNYGFVCHMNDVGDTSSLCDSSSYNINGTKILANGPLQVNNVSGTIGYAQYFNGSYSVNFSSDYSDLSGMEVGTGPATIVAHTYVASTDTDLNAGHIFNTRENIETRQIQFYLYYSPHANEGKINNAWWDAGLLSCISTNTVSTPGWNYMAGKRVGTTTYARIADTWNDGVGSVDSDFTSTDAIILGVAYGGVGEWYIGQIDEVRFSNVVRNDSWHKANRNTFAQTEGFVTMGAQQGEGPTPSVYTIKGLPNDIVTWSGMASATVWCNSSGDTNEWLEVNMSINTTDNVTEIRVWVGDLNNSVDINASNITMYVTNNANTTYYSFGAFSDGGSNITINKTTWQTYASEIDNPFNGTGLTDTNTSIFLIFKLAIPADAPTDIFWSISLTAWKIYL